MKLGTKTHSPVSLAGTLDYLTISDQEITRGTIDIADDTNLAAGTGITLTDDTLSTNDSEIDHGSLAGLDTGADHSYIDQSVTSGSSPTFDGTNFTGIPDGALDSTFLKNIVEDTTPQLGGDLDLNGKNIDFPTTANVSDCLDEDNMISNSATALATQQSIKAYVDAAAAGTAAARRWGLM